MSALFILSSVRTEALTPNIFIINYNIHIIVKLYINLHMKPD